MRFYSRIYTRPGHRADRRNVGVILVPRKGEVIIFRKNISIPIFQYLNFYGRSRVEREEPFPHDMQSHGRGLRSLHKVPPQEI